MHVCRLVARMPYSLLRITCQLPPKVATGHVGLTLALAGRGLIAGRSASWTAPRHGTHPPRTARRHHGRCRHKGSHTVASLYPLLSMYGPAAQALGNSRSYEVEDELEDELDELSVPRGEGGGLAGGARAATEAVVGRVRKAVDAAAAAMGPRAGAAGAKAATEAGAGVAKQEQAAAVAAAEAEPAPAAKEGVKGSGAPSTGQSGEVAAEAAGATAAGDGKGSGPGWLSNLRRTVLGPGRS